MMMMIGSFGGAPMLIIITNVTNRAWYGKKVDCNRIEMDERNRTDYDH